MRQRLLFALFFILVSGQAHAAIQSPVPNTGRLAQDSRAEQLARTLETRGLMSTPAQFAAWEKRASATQGDERLEQLRRVSVEALTASDLTRANRWMALYAQEIEARRSARHGRALAQLKAYKIGIEGDFSGAAAELTRMMAGERDPFLRAAGARLLAYSSTLR